MAFENRYSHRKGRIRAKGFLPAVAVCMLIVWLSGQMHGLGGIQETEQWSVESHDRTNFPLVGRHRTVSCLDCHLDGVFEGTPTECEVCHWARRQDDRYELRLGIHCAECHVPLAWKQVAPDKWNHEMAAGYPLEGVHRTLDCVECHGDKWFMKVNVDCFGCHESAYRETRDPDHTAADFSTECHLCHFNNTSWAGAHFSHDAYLLKGQHKFAGCSDCHRNNQYRGLPSDCLFCHQEDYDGAKDPDHRKSNFPTDCEVCHSSDASTWENVVFDHSAFSLSGRHRVIDCLDCHRSGQYEGLPSTCVFCHLEDYLNASDPDHKQLGFHTDCEVCHGTDALSWEDVTMVGHSFPINLGKHAKQDCIDCHVTANYRDFSCLNCHAHDKTQMDNRHRDVPGYSFDSQSCYACHPEGRE